MCGKQFETYLRASGPGVQILQVFEAKELCHRFTHAHQRLVLRCSELQLLELRLLSIHFDLRKGLLDERICLSCRDASACQCRNRFGDLNGNVGV